MLLVLLRTLIYHNVNIIGPFKVDSGPVDIHIHFRVKKRESDREANRVNVTK
jgi:hypothetical protein